MIRRNKSVGPDSIPDTIWKMGGEAMIPYLAQLLDITINNGTIPRDWKKTIVVFIHKGGNRLVVKNYRLVHLTSVVCKQNGTHHSRCGKIGIGYMTDNMASDRDTHARIK